MTAAYRGTVPHACGTQRRYAGGKSLVASSNGGPMSILDRAKRISLHPQLEWPVIAEEPASVAGIVSGYLAPLAAISPVALVIGLSIVGVGVPFIGTYRAPLGSSIVQAVFTFIMILIMAGAMSAIASALAPNFGGRRDSVAAIKLVGYSYTPALIAGVLGLFPPLTFFEIFAALWTLYVFYRGATPLALSAPGKALPYTAACMACGIALGFVLMLAGGAVGLMTGAFSHHDSVSARSSEGQARAVAAGILGSAMGGGAGNTQSAQKMVDSVAAAGDEAQAAADAKDPDAQTQAGLKAIGALVHGGRDAVKPIAHDDLKALLPESAGGLPRIAAEGSSGSFAGITGSSADAKYGTDAGNSIEISVADLGNMGGIAAVANIAATARLESDSDAGYEKNVDVDGRRVHEKWTNDGKHSELLEIVDNRYTVTVDGTGVDMDTAVAALRGVDMAKFQALGAAAK
jgi:hypothetical protein